MSYPLRRAGQAQRTFLPFVEVAAFSATSARREEATFFGAGLRPMAAGCLSGD
jgi:hypothetical protein